MWMGHIPQNIFKLIQIFSIKKNTILVLMCVRVCPRLLEFLQRLLRPKDKLKWDIFTVTVWSTTGAQNMLCYFAQRGRADDPRVAKSGNDLVLQQPSDLTHTHRKEPR